jgi:hypothetical protein
MREVGHLARMGERRGAYVRNSERKRPLGRPKIRKKIILK